jgi:hypothetical protein
MVCFHGFLYKQCLKPSIFQEEINKNNYNWPGYSNLKESKYKAEYRWINILFKINYQAEFILFFIKFG